MQKQTIAVFYQSKPPPSIDGIKKPFKPGGYSDSGADIAFTLREAGHNILTPIPNPDPTHALDWVFPDSDMGLRQAFLDGGNVFWMNTVLYAGHPIDRIRSNDLWIVGQDAEATQLYDNKFYTNTLLAEAGLPVAQSAVIEGHNPQLSDSFVYPVILKPIRGRGSAGVTLVRSEDELLGLVKHWVATDEFGSSFMVEEFLLGEEITISVMPKGIYNIAGIEVKKDAAWALPPVRRTHHIEHIAPYNGTVPIVHNSTLYTEIEMKEQEVIRIHSACEMAADVIDIIAPIRIDCRRDKDNSFKIFDVNMKPNITGAGRPGRDDQDSLISLAAKAVGWGYKGLLENILRNAWPSK